MRAIGGSWTTNRSVAERFWWNSIIQKFVMDMDLKEKEKKQRDDHGRPLWHLILDHILAFDLFDDHQSCWLHTIQSIASFHDICNLTDSVCDLQTWNIQIGPNHAVFSPSLASFERLTSDWTVDGLCAAPARDHIASISCKAPQTTHPEVIC